MSTTEQLAPVTQLEPRAARSGQRTGQAPRLIVLAVAAALACSPLAFGYYSFTAWAPLGLGAVVLLVMLAFGPRCATLRLRSYRGDRARVAAGAELRVDPLG